MKQLNLSSGKMENKIIKERSNNFSQEELKKLTDLLEKNPIILNKKTDHASNKQKDEAWSLLTNEFNSNNPAEQLIDQTVSIIGDQETQGIDTTLREFDTSTPKSMLKKPVSKQLESANRKRKIVVTPLETRKKIVSMANEKEEYLKKKRKREEKVLEYCEEEHSKNMLNKEQLHQMDVEFKKKFNELVLKKASLEVQIEEEKLKKLQFENKDLDN